MAPATSIVYDRPLTDDDRALLSHIMTQGREGIVRRLGKHWTWDFRSIRAPVLFDTKREATKSFDAYLTVVYDCDKAEKQRRRVRPCPCGRMTSNDCAGECGWQRGQDHDGLLV